MAYEVASTDLVTMTKRIGRPHVVVLGAGASLAAFPTGDARGRRLPLMANLIDTLDLKDAVLKAALDPALGFETLYSQLHATDPSSTLIKLIEKRVHDYFSGLVLPRYTTLYDLLLMSLREKDAIFTFNWDPFLVDAYERLVGKVPVPQIFHLHGNVRVGFCEDCGLAMKPTGTCSSCDKPLVPTRLLYPVEQKNYADDPFIASQWHNARDFIGRAFIITIFGYSAPKTDREAMDIFTKAWKTDEKSKLVERLEIIDVRDGDELAEQWSPFAIFDHRDMRRSFSDSVLSQYPRRTCEALYHMGVKGKFVEPIPWAGNMEGALQDINRIAAHESSQDESQ